MELENEALASTANLTTKVTEVEWREFRAVCEAEVANGGERGAIAARMLSLSERLRSLSTDVDRALGQFPDR